MREFGTIFGSRSLSASQLTFFSSPVASTFTFRTHAHLGLAPSPWTATTLSLHVSTLILLYCEVNDTLYSWAQPCVQNVEPERSLDLFIHSVDFTSLVASTADFTMT
jgi:hypothetical protein